MDFVKRDVLLKRIGDVNNAPVVVSLEDFFVGNDDRGSIWCNVQGVISPKDVFKILSKLRTRDDVADVVIKVTQYDGSPEEWPFSDTVYVITTTAAEEVVMWFDRDFMPNEYWLSNTHDELRSLHVPAGMHAVGLWWD